MGINGYAVTSAPVNMHRLMVPVPYPWCTGCWYVAESGSIMSLAPSGARGKYLALWIVSRNLGQLIGGAIK
jgi:hypothetical protein